MTTFVRPLLISAIMGVATFGIYHLTYLAVPSNVLGILVSVPIAMVIYGTGIVITGTVTEDELLEMPMGGRLVRICRKVHLM